MLKAGSYLLKAGRYLLKIEAHSKVAGCIFIKHGG
jgi:hypothetical protein